ELLPEAEQAERALRLAVVPALLAREEARDEILLLVRELDAGGALAHWWQGFPESARQRGWQVGVHQPASLIPATSSLHRGGFWSDPKPPNWLTEQLSVSDRKPLQVLLAVRGPFANALLALELGLQAVMPTERG